MSVFPSRNKVIDDLPELSVLRTIMLESWHRWMTEIPPVTRIDLCDSARAFVVHSFIKAAAIKHFGSTAKPFDKSKLKLFVIGEYAIRFKKHDAELVSRNQETKQVKNFMQQLPLTGVPATFNLEAGYVLDSAGTEIISTNLVCPNGYKNRPYWHVELHDDGYELSDIEDLFPENPLPEDADTGARWKRRDSGVVIPFTRTKKP